MVAAFLLSCALLLQEAPTVEVEPTPIRIACIGDSITFGAQLADRGHHSYPAQLGMLLGEGYLVRNFGVGGATLLREADRPIHTTTPFSEMLEWKPQLAIVILGTNDTCDTPQRPNWQKQGALEADASALVSALLDVGVTRILLAAPPPMCVATAGLSDGRVADLEKRRARLPRIATAFSSVADQVDDVQFLNLDGSLRPHWTSDGVHPNPIGQESIALRVATGIFGDPPLHSTWARPSAEYRGSAAGWGKGNWHGALDHLRAEAAAHPDTPLVFLGDSVTQSLTGHGNRTTDVEGGRAIDVAFGSGGAISLGLSGDRTEHLLYRIRHGALPLLQPRVIVLQIGVNNINAAGHDAASTAAGIVEVVRLLRREQSQARVIICGPFPAGRSADDPRRTTVDRVHEAIARLGNQPMVDYLDLRPLFLAEDGAANDKLAGDGIHITESGRRAWMQAIADHLAQAADARD